MPRNWRQAKAIEEQNKKRLLEVNPNLDNGSGIYIMTRTDENGFKYAYVGQAVNIMQRMCQHMTGYQHIDLSLKSHGLYSIKNHFGWKIGFLHYSVDDLDKYEQYWIKKYADEGYQLRNKTSGSQGEGKTKIDDFRPAKGYHDGLKQGMKNASKEMSHLFEKHLNVSCKSDKPNKIQEKALDKFNEFLNYYKTSD